MSTSTEKEKPQDPGKHQSTIFINGRRVEVREKELTFEQVVELSGLPTGPEILFTISYRKGGGKKPEGSMVQGGDPVKIKDGTIFNVESTNRS